MVQNLFAAHSQGMSMLQKQMSAGLTQTDPTQGQPGTVTFAGKVMPAVVGLFEMAQRFVSGGVQESLDAFVYIQKSDMSAAGFSPKTTFKNGEFITVTQPGSQTRQCSVVSSEDKYSFWVLTVADASENA